MRADRRRKPWMWVAGGLILIVIVGLVIWQFAKNDLSKPPGQSKLKPVISGQFKKMITEASDSLYTVTYSSFDVNIDSGYARIRNFQLLPDSAAYQRLQATGKAPNNIFKIKAGDILLEDFGFVKVEGGRKFNIKRMSLTHSSVMISNRRFAYNDSSREDKHGALYKLMQPIFKRMSVGAIYMRDLDFVYANKNEKQEKYDRLSNLNIIISDFNTSPAPSGKGGVIARTGALRMTTPDKLYDLIFKGMVFSAPERLLFTDHFSLLPRLNKTDFYKRVKYSKDRYHFEYDKVSMNNIDLERFLRRQQLRIGRMDIADSWVEVYTDYNWPARNVPPRRNAFPQEKLQTIALDVTIDTMTMKHGDTFFRILAKNSKEVSTLSMRHSKGRFFTLPTIRRLKGIIHT